ncbi:MAG: hypothetical protein BroJett003_11200 [Planctomycetota bacterium]|nr:MAG: hypothetical protein BroJett003_11200 [Planctomycetota bacterium]
MIASGSFISIQSVKVVRQAARLCDSRMIEFRRFGEDRMRAALCLENIVVLVSPATVAPAECWQVVGLHPEGADSSNAVAAAGGSRGGSAEYVGVDHPVLRRGALRNPVARASSGRDQAFLSFGRALKTTRPIRNPRP